jgi:phosphoglycerate dehydrogenase-like enzyme
MRHASRPLRVLCHVRPALAERIAAALPDVDVIPIPTDDPPPGRAEGEILLTLGRAVPNLLDVLGRGVRWVHILGTGVDGFPIERLTHQMLTCSRGGSAVPIAEWVLAVMLAFEKRLPDAWVQAAPTEWSRRIGLGTLSGKTLGLIGIGGIGAAVAARARPFGLRMRACRRSAAPAAVAGVEIVGSVAELAATADHLVVAAPATAATRHLIGREVLAAVKPGIHLVNVARGALVDHDALRAALDDGRIARASLDAVDPEPLPDGHWLYTHPRVRLSPHVSWDVPGAADMLLEPFIENLRRYRAGEPLTGLVDRAAGY